MAEDKQVVLKVRGLKKEYGGGFPCLSQRCLAVCGLDFEVYRGEIFGFLGPNGAGKTTTLHMLTGIARATGGHIEVFGRDFRSPQIWPLERIGYLPETAGFPAYTTIRELLVFFANFYGLSRSFIKERVHFLLDVSGLSSVAWQSVKSLSMGQRRLVDFILSLINDPDLIFLDEPTVYLDPLAVERFREILIALKRQGKAILISSHTLSLIEKLSDRIGIIHRGRFLKVDAREKFLLEPGGLEAEFLRLVREAS